jgi:hypothetical protein
MTADPGIQGLLPYPLPFREDPCHRRRVNLRMRRMDLHHPTIRADRLRGWTWTCQCGGSSPRDPSCSATWHDTMVGALYHAMTNRL